MLVERRGSLDGDRGALLNAPDSSGTANAGRGLLVRMRAGPSVADKKRRSASCVELSDMSGGKMPFLY
jgi:hypothetical protein